jgi:hypothetical protein
VIGRAVRIIYLIILLICSNKKMMVLHIGTSSSSSLIDYMATISLRLAPGK